MSKWHTHATSTVHYDSDESTELSFTPYPAVEAGCQISSADLTCSSNGLLKKLLSTLRINILKMISSQSNWDFNILNYGNKRIASVFDRREALRKPFNRLLFRFDALLRLMLIQWVCSHTESMSCSGIHLDLAFSFSLL
jgi:hypothetical protein